MLIIARYKEDISWSDGQERFIVQKGEHMPNWGKEPSSFLWYIIQHYDTLSGLYQFRQGNPFDHYPHRAEILDTSKHGCPYHSGLPLEYFEKESGFQLPDRWQFHPGGQFDATAEQIKKYPKSFYEKLYKMVEENELVAWVLERTWELILK
jgi:hypothetical protein